MGKIGGFLDTTRGGRLSAIRSSGRATSASSMGTLSLTELRNQGARCMEWSSGAGTDGLPLPDLVPETGNVLRLRAGRPLARHGTTNSMQRAPWFRSSVSGACP